MSLKHKVVIGVLWSLLEKFTAQFSGFIVTLVLARLLTPDDYGTVALLTLVINISAVLLSCGFGQALVQKKNADDLDFNSVFYLSIGVSVVLYGTLFVLAPAVARFYSRPELVSLLRVLALTLPLNAIGGVQSAELSRKLLFNLSFRISWTRFVVTAMTGLSLALLKFGPWALVMSTVLGCVANVIASWKFIGWRPSLMFSWQRLGGLFSFGWKFSASWFLSVIYENIQGMIIGRVYTPADLAFVAKGRQIPNLAITAINGTIGTVTFPAMAQLQDEKDRVRFAMRKMIQCTTFVTFPMMFGLAVCARDVIPIFFGEQWGASVPFLMVACFSFLLYPFHTINLQTLSAIGRTDIFLWLEIVKKILGFTVMICSYRFGVLWMMASSAFIVGPLGVFINAFPNQKILHYTVAMQVKDTMPTFWVCCAMAAVVYPFCYLPLPSIARVALQTFVGAGVFVGVAWCFRIEPLRIYVECIDSVFAKKIPVRFLNVYEKFKRSLEG